MAPVVAGWVAGLLPVGSPGEAQAQNHSEIFFDDSGGDQAFFGPNEIITISGSITYLGLKGVPLHDVNARPIRLLARPEAGFLSK